MLKRFSLLPTVYSTVFLTACLNLSPGDRVPVADENSLRESFVAQIASVEGVMNFKNEANEITFLGPDGLGGNIEWRVYIDSAMDEPYDDENYPYRGIVLSSWHTEGQEIEITRSPTGSNSNLPAAFLNAGLAQDCWGLWDTTANRWSWT